ncbi:hypothetical protein [Streptomyces chartreusis]|uniref:hypothetical protein n=1 Tax=Streptomyces chartreusis TaxID=1969 RepID=UPI0037F613B0
MTSAPELFGIPVAVLALAVAGAGFVVSFIALGWQISKHMLDGGRVRVYLNAATWEPDARLTTNNTGKWKMQAGEFGGAAKENIELAQLVVENPGRTAITIHRPGLAISTRGKKEYFVTPRMFKLENYGSDTATAETVVRIDPYDRVTFLLDYWSVIHSPLAESQSTHISVRGSVLVAGRKRPRKSSKRLAWKIPKGAWTAYLDANSISPFTVMWREICRSRLGGKNPNGSETSLPINVLGGVLFEAMRKFDELPSREDLRSAIREVAKEWKVSHLPLEIALFRMYESLDLNRKNLGPWPHESVDIAPVNEAPPGVIEVDRD